MTKIYPYTYKKYIFTLFPQRRNFRELLKREPVKYLAFQEGGGLRTYIPLPRKPELFNTIQDMVEEELKKTLQSPSSPN